MRIIDIPPSRYFGTGYVVYLVYLVCLVYLVKKLYSLPSRDGRGLRGGCSNLNHPHSHNAMRYALCAKGEGSIKTPSAETVPVLQTQ